MNLATVLEGEHKGKIVGMLEFTLDGLVLCELGTSEEDEENVIVKIRREHLREWINVKSVKFDEDGTRTLVHMDGSVEIRKPRNI